MSTISIRNSILGGGLVLEDNKSLDVDNIITATESIQAGVAGTAGSAGAMTLAEGHGITDSDIVAVTWATGKRYGCTVSNSGATSITVSSGTGDTLPTSGAVVISKKTEIDLAFSGTNLSALSMGADIATMITLEDAGGVELYKAISANEAYQWNANNGETNPVTGDSIIRANVYNQGTSAGTAKILAAYNND